MAACQPAPRYAAGVLWVRKLGPELPWGALIVMVAGARLWRRVALGAWGGDLPGALAVFIMAAYLVLPFVGIRLARGGAQELPALTRARVGFGSMWGPVATMLVAFPIDGGLGLFVASIASVAVAFVAILVVAAIALAKRRGESRPV